MLVSVIMSSRGEKELKQSVESIMKQTYNKIELILINDGSKNKDIFDKLEDKYNNRIFVIHNKQKKGLTASLNIALKKSNGELIVRQDANAISKKNRIEEIVNYFKKNKNIDIIGSYAKISVNGKESIVRPPLNHDEIKKNLDTRNCLVHTSIAFRMKVYEKLRGYDERFVYAQDYDLYLRALQEGFKFGVIDKVLVIKDFGSKSTTIANRQKQLMYALAAQSFYLAKTKKYYKIIPHLTKLFLYPIIKIVRGY